MFINDEEYYAFLDRCLDNDGLGDIETLTPGKIMKTLEKKDRQIDENIERFEKLFSEELGE